MVTTSPVLGKNSFPESIIGFLGSSGFGVGTSSPLIKVIPLGVETCPSAASTVGICNQKVTRKIIRSIGYIFLFFIMESPPSIAILFHQYIAH